MTVPPTPLRLSNNTWAPPAGRRACFSCRPTRQSLTPDQLVWKNVKHDAVGRTVAMSKGHLYGTVYDALWRFQTTPQIIEGFFRPLSCVHLRRALVSLTSPETYFPL